MKVPGKTEAITRWMSEDHARLDGLLQQALADPASIDMEPYGEFRSGLLRHIGIEEKILLPAAQRARGGVALEAAARLRLDHGAVVALLVPTPTPAILATIRDILEDHNALEESTDGLYATCDRLLAGEIESLVQEMAAYPEPRVNPHNDGPDVMRAVGRALERAGYCLLSGT